jgi:hypothetical protein
MDLLQKHDVDLKAIFRYYRHLDLRAFKTDGRSAVTLQLQDGSGADSSSSTQCELYCSTLYYLLLLYYLLYSR